jgi:hypothetical protein
MLKAVIATVALSATTLAFADNAFDARIVAERIIGFHSGCLGTATSVVNTRDGYLLAETITRLNKLCKDDALNTLPEKYRVIPLSNDMWEYVNSVEEAYKNSIKTVSKGPSI